MIETLALLDREWIDRELVERIFDLRKTAAFHLLRRMGAQRCGNSLGIGRDRLMARLREAQENRDWRWESDAANRFSGGSNPLKLHRRKIARAGGCRTGKPDRGIASGWTAGYDPAHGRTTHHPLQ